MWAMLFRLLMLFGGFFIKDIFLSLGVGLVSYFGFNYIITVVFDKIQLQLDGLFPELLSILNIMGFTTGLSILASSIVSSLAIMFLFRPIALRKVYA